MLGEEWSFAAIGSGVWQHRAKEFRGADHERTNRAPSVLAKQTWWRMILTSMCAYIVVAFVLGAGILLARIKLVERKPQGVAIACLYFATIAAWLAILIFADGNDPGTKFEHFVIGSVFGLAIATIAQKYPLR